MPDASDLADAPVASPLPLPLSSVPTGARADVPPPRPAQALPTLRLASGPARSTSVGGSAVGDAGASGATLDPVAAAASSSNPHAMAAAAHFAAMKQDATRPSVKPVRGKKQRRGRRPIVVPVLLLGVLGGAAYVGRDSSIMARLKGDGYDSSILPMVVYPRPTPASIEQTSIEYLVSVENGVPWVDEAFRSQVIDPTTGDVQTNVRETRRSVGAGELVDPPVSAADREVIALGGFWYIEPKTEGDPWLQQPRRWGSTGARVDDVLMYQDVIDQSLRRVAPVSVTDDTIGGVVVTTYEFAIPLGELYESAPFVFAQFSSLDGNAAPDSIASLTVSVDGDGVVRVIDITLELEAVIEQAKQRGDGLSYPYRWRLELDSLDDTPPSIQAPANVEPPVVETVEGA